MDHDDRPQQIGTDEARAGETPHVTRYILAISIAAVVIAFAILLSSWMTVD